MTDIDKYVTRKRYMIFNMLVGVCLAVFAAAVTLLYFWLFDSRAPVEVKAAYPIKPAFAVGEPIVVEERMMVHRRCPGSVSRAIIDGANVAYPILLPSDPLLSMTSDRTRIEFRMPAMLGPGRYRYRAEAAWQCNPMRIVRQLITDVPFEVVGADRAEQATESTKQHHP